MEFKSFYKDTSFRKFNTWCLYTKRLDMYGCGCVHDCEYCYSKSLLDFRGFWNNKFPRISDLNKLAKKVKNLQTSTVLRLGGMSDCFQDIKKTEKLTFKSIKILNHYKIHYLIVTKSNLVVHDEYLDIYDKRLAHFQITITNTDDKRAACYEKCSLVSDRIIAIEKLYKLGFDVSIRLSPFIEGFIDYNILNSINCDKLLVEFLKVNSFIRKNFNIDYSDYMVEYGGYRHLPLYKKLILLKNIKRDFKISIGEYVKDHYEYFKKNINYNKYDCCNLNIEKNHIAQLKLF